MGPGFKTRCICVKNIGLQGLEDEVFVVFDDGSLPTDKLGIKQVVSRGFFALILNFRG